MSRKRKPLYTPEQEQFVLSNLNILSVEEMAKQLGKPRSSVFTFIHNKGINKRLHPNLYDINVTQFSNVQTPEAAYILGYIWADGYVYAKKHSVILNCTKDDMDDIEWVFDKTGKWFKYNNIRLKLSKRTNRMFMTHNPIFSDLLISLDYIEKSLMSPAKVLASIPVTLRHMFWRGYMDGDGCIFVSAKGHGSVSIAGSHDQDWSSVMELGRELNVVFMHWQQIKGNHRGSQVTMKIQAHVQRFLEWIYSDYETNKIGLKRKREKMIQLLKYIKDRPKSKAGYRGVSKNRQSRFYANIVVAGKRTFLGNYPTAYEAAIAYDQGAVRLIGVRARTNFPIENYLTPLPHNT